ncbi:MAG: universal stress protein [Terracidiphilus sp.]
MASPLKPGWSKPSTILFASEFPANEKAFASALAQSAEFGADLIIFHAYAAPDGFASAASGGRRHNCAAVRAEKLRFEALAQRARDLGIHCRIVVRPGSPAEEILAFLQGRKIDRIVMGAHTPGPVGRLLVGSVAETVLRSACMPVSVVGPHVVEGTYRNFYTRTILCSTSAHEFGHVVARFAAELAVRHHARLILQHVIPPQESAETLAGRTLAQMEAELLALVPAGLLDKISVRARVALGDPTEELLYQGRVLQANLLVLGAQGASHFAAVTRAGIVYKVLAYAHCPVMTLSPVVLAGCGAAEEAFRPSEVRYLAGVV